MANSSCRWRLIPSFGLAGGLDERMFVGHAAAELRGLQLGVDQPVLQPLQRRLRFEQPIGRGDQLARVVLGGLEHAEQLLVRLVRGLGLAQFAANFADGPLQGAVPGVAVVEDPKLGQIGADLSLEPRQLRGRSVEVGLGKVKPPCRARRSCSWPWRRGSAASGFPLGRRSRRPGRSLDRGRGP